MYNELISITEPKIFGHGKYYHNTVLVLPELLKVKIENKIKSCLFIPKVIITLKSLTWMFCSLEMIKQVILWLLFIEFICCN